MPCVYFIIWAPGLHSLFMLPTLSHSFIHVFQNLIHPAAELFSCRCPSLWTFSNGIWYLHFYIAVEFAVNFICKCTTLMLWKVVIDGQVDGARRNILAIFCCTPLQAPEASPEFLSLSNIVMLSLSVYVTYAGIGNVNSWLFSVSFEWSTVCHIFFMKFIDILLHCACCFCYIWIDIFLLFIACIHNN